METTSLGDRLKELIRESCVDQQDIAENIGIKRSTFNGYVNNTREPNISVLKLIANYFKVSVDYLIGYSDERNMSFYHLSEELNSFVSNPQNAPYISLAKDLKENTNLSSIAR